MINHVEPLEPNLWFARIEKIAHGELGCMENSLRHAAHLLQLTPASLRPQVGLAIDEEAFETLLEASDFDTAARHLIAQPTALWIEPGDGESRIIARIKCSVRGRYIDGYGRTIAEAVLDAWTNCLLAVRTEFGANLVSLPDLFPHTGQSAQHPRPS
jgi:hypothetical protein